MSYISTDNFDFDDVPDGDNIYEVIIHIILTDPYTVKLDTGDLFEFIKDLKKGNLIFINDLVIPSSKIKFLEIHKIEETKYVN